MSGKRLKDFGLFEGNSQWSDEDFARLKEAGRYAPKDHDDQVDAMRYAAASLLQPKLSLWKRIVRWLRERITGAFSYFFDKRRINLPQREIAVSVSLLALGDSNIWHDPILGEHYDVIAAKYGHPQKTYLVQPYRIIPSRFQVLMTHIKWQFRRIVRGYIFMSDASVVRDMRRRGEL